MRVAFQGFAKPGAAGGGGGGFPTNAVLDNFNRATEGPPPSSSWAGPILTTDGQFKVNTSNVAENMSGIAAGNYWNTSFNANQEGYLKINTGSVDGVELCGRINAPNTSGVDYIVINVYGPSGGVRVFDVTNGSYSQLGATITQSMSDGDSIGFTAIGTTITVYYKVGAGSWSSIGTRTTSITGSGYIGMRGEASVGVDDFGGGNI